MAIDISDAKDAEKALRDSEHHHKAIFSSLQDTFILVLDSEGNHIYSFEDTKLKRKYGIKQIFGKSISTFFTDKEESNRALKRIKQVFKTNKSYRDEYYITHKKGTSWLDITFSPVNDSFGKVSAVVAYIHDISTQKSVEEQLKHHIQFENLITSISTKFINYKSDEIDKGVHDAIKKIGQFASVDRSYVFLFHDKNTRMTNTHEWCARGIKSHIKRLHNLPVDDFKWWNKKIRRSQSIHIPRITELPGEAAAEKREFNLEGIKSLVSVPLKYKNSIIGFIGFDSVKAEKTWYRHTISLLRIVAQIFANALQRKTIEEELRKSESKYKDIATHIPGIVYQFLLKNDGTYSLPYVSENARKYFGYTLKEIEKLSSRFFDFVAPEDVEGLLKSIMDTRRSMGTGTVEFRLMTKSGELKWLRATSSPHMLGDGSVIWNGVAVDITERKNAEDALINSEIRYRTTIDSMADAIHVIDRNFNIILCNKQFLKWNRELRLNTDIIGNNILDLCPFLTKKIKQEYDNVFNTGKGIITEEINVFSGTEITTDTRKIPIIEDNKVTRIITVIRDISDRKRAEKELLKEQSKARNYLDIAEVMLLVIDANQIVRLINRKGCRILGYSDKEIIGKNWFDSFIPIHNREKIKTVFNQIISAQLKSLEYFENTVLNRDGEERLIAWHNTVIKDDMGKISGTLSSGEDITQRKQSEYELEQYRKYLVKLVDERTRELREINAFKESIITTIPTGIVVIDKNYRILSINQRFFELFEKKPKYVTGLQYCRFIECEKQKEQCPILKTFNDFFRDNKVQFKELECTHNINGKQKIFKTYITFMNEINAVLFVIQDITESKMLQNQLVHSERLAATGRLAASIAHEINNPLQGITTHLEIVRDSLPADFKETESYEFIRDNIDKIRDTVKQLLDIYRISDQTKDSVDINNLILKVNLLLKNPLKIKDIRFELNLDTAIPRIIASEQHLYQVILNIILNALDSTSKGGKITISTATINNNIEVLIHDTGKGIISDDLQHIFDPFFSTKKGKGTGLGLYICQEIIKNHGGEIRVESQVGEGSSFVISLPKEPYDDSK